MTEHGNVYPRLTKPLLIRSISDDYEEAKKEWRMTGNVWRGAPHQHECGHLGQCLCGKNIVWHFEIENTHTDELQILGSSCIENWMVLRHLTEVKGMDIADVTDETIEHFLATAVNEIKAEWWFEQHGKIWNMMYDAVAEIDLRTNINPTKKKTWDSETRRYETVTTIRKRAKGKPNDPDYQMASVIWRWNHPDNQKNQQEKYGFPQDRLFEDVCILWSRVNMEKERIKLEDEERENRIASLKAKEIAATLRAEEQRRVQNEIFEKNCDFFGLPTFDVDNDSSNDWEKRFLRDMKSRIIRDLTLTNKQFQTLQGILTGEGPTATDRQLRYLAKLGVQFEGPLTKKKASDLIGQELARRAENAQE